MTKLVVIVSIVIACVATIYSFSHGWIIAYGDAESHLNIAKRVVHSVTPGLAQLGGIWLPLPHLLLIPFTYFDTLWRTGLAGSIVSGAAFVISALYIYRLAHFVSGSAGAGVFSAAVFISNPNILYLQSTPMTELSLISLFVVSIYYFTKFLYDDRDVVSLVLAAAAGCAATLTRYDGWLLVVLEAGLLGLYYVQNKGQWHKLEGRMVLFCTLAFAGIVFWLLWGLLILGDPLYFTHSEYSAKSQQQGWLARGELPAYNNLLVSFLYFFAASLSNVGVLIFCTALLGAVLYVLDLRWSISRRFAGRKLMLRLRWYILLLLLAPFIFNVLTLFLGQSVIFIPSLTPDTFQYQLFNVRYGALMIPAAAFILGYMFYRFDRMGKALLASLIIAQAGMYMSGQAQVISFLDGTQGLSSSVAKLSDAQAWMQQNYDGGYVLMDDFARSISIIRANIPMEALIYVGNQPYWEESFVEPEKYATWIIMQKDDVLWRTILQNPKTEMRLYTYFAKVYTSPQILIFKRNF